MRKTDVCVVGGGPGGASAAGAAARHGADVVVLERGVPREDRKELGPDSTDAAGMVDYWVDLMDLDVEELPDDIVLRRLEGAELCSPRERCFLQSTGIDSSYPHYGFTFHRARMDDWLRTNAEENGAEYRTAATVSEVTTDLSSTPTHTVRLRGGAAIQAQSLVLADGPQRQVTIPTLDQFLPEGRSIADELAPTRANHIGYQEYRRFPPDVFDSTRLRTWWGLIPGETAYLWVFPNEENIARVGLTMPLGLSIDEIDDPRKYPLMREDDESIPAGNVFIQRLLEREYGDEYDIDDAFSFVDDRGKENGVESYPISSTRPIGSPVGANVAVVGGAMGATSAAHEGGYHLASKTGELAGRLAATGSLDQYNRKWNDALGEEILRNVAMAEVFRNFDPDDWDTIIRNLRELSDSKCATMVNWGPRIGIGGLMSVLRYKWMRLRFGSGRYVQMSESDYQYATTQTG